MEITEIRVALREAHAPRPDMEPSRVLGERRLKAYATVTFDRCFVVRNVKIIEGRNGLFVAMPSNKPKLACPSCQVKGDAGGRFCIHCGHALNRPLRQALEAGRGFGERAPSPETESSDAQAHRDIAHPITAEFRQYLQQRVLGAYEAELEKHRSVEPVGA